MYDFSNSKRGETFISIIVGTIILAIAITGVVMILMQNRSLEEDYDKNNTLALLRANTESILQKTDTSFLGEREVFYLFKNPNTHTFQVFTGIVNDGYKYIDRYGENITNTGTYLGTVYTRIFILEKGDDFAGRKTQIIKGGIKELIRKQAVN